MSTSWNPYQPSALPVELLDAPTVRASRRFAKSANRCAALEGFKPVAPRPAAWRIAQHAAVNGAMLREATHGANSAVAMETQPVAAASVTRSPAVPVWALLDIHGTVLLGLGPVERFGTDDVDILPG